MAEKETDDRTGKGPRSGSRMLTPEEREELRRWGREALEYCREEFKKNAL